MFREIELCLIGLEDRAGDVSMYAFLTEEEAAAFIERECLGPQAEPDEEDGAESGAESDAESDAESGGESDAETKAEEPEDDEDGGAAEETPSMAFVDLLAAVGAAGGPYARAFWCVDMVKVEA